MRSVVLSRAAVSAALALAPFEAAAGPDADAARLQACLDGAGAETARGCIGIVAEPCIGAPGGETTVGTTACLESEHAAWDMLLSRFWKPLMARARSSDEASGASLPEGMPRAAEALRAAQRAWLAFRDAECAHAAAQWGMGSMRLVAGADCLRTLTAERAAEFNRRLRTDG